MATILEVISEFCHRINVPAPTSIVGVSRPTEQQYLSIFKKIGDDLRNRPFNWPQLKREYTFLTVTDERRYQLPGDFYRLLESNEWDLTNKWPLRGPMSDFAFTTRKYSVVSLQTRKGYNLIGPVQHLYNTSPYSQRSAGVIQIDPAGANDTDELLLGYISCNWVWPEDWVAGASYSAGDIRAGNGYVYRTAAGGTAGATRPNWTTGTDSDDTVDWTVYTEPYLVNSSNANLSDADLCLFDDDIMVEGMHWYYMKLKGLDYQQERVDWEEMVKGAVSRFNGPKRTNMADAIGTYEDQEWPLVPFGNWSL